MNEVHPNQRDKDAKIILFVDPPLWPQLREKDGP